MSTFLFLTAISDRKPREMRGENLDYPSRLLRRAAGGKNS